MQILCTGLVLLLEVSCTFHIPRNFCKVPENLWEPATGICTALVSLSNMSQDVCFFKVGHQVSDLVVQVTLRVVWQVYDLGSCMEKWTRKICDVAELDRVNLVTCGPLAIRLSVLNLITSTLIRP
jgi:hypothetical protein